jgi:hypothetical protein
MAKAQARISRWTLAVLAFAFAATFVLHQTRSWIWLGVPPIGTERVPFSDAAAQLDAADACSRGFGERIGGACFLPSADVAVHSQTYEPWLAFQRWGLTGRVYVEAAWTIIALFYLATVLSFGPDRAGEAAWLLLFLFSAATQLAVERANFDLLTSAILCAAAALLATPGWAAAAAGCLLLGLDTSLKLYTGISSAFAWITRSCDRQRTAAFAISSTLGAIAVVGVHTILALRRHAPEGETRFSTGAHWLMRTHGSGWTIAAATAASAVAIFAWRRLPLNAAVRAAIEREPRRVALLQVASLTAIPLFFLKDSYDYRLVLWLPCLALPVALLRDPALDGAWRRGLRAMLVLAAIVFCAELPCRWLDQAAEATANAWPRAIAEAITLAKQLSAWVLAALLAALFARITAAHFATVHARERSVPIPVR